LIAFREIVKNINIAGFNQAFFRPFVIFSKSDFRTFAAFSGVSTIRNAKV
jgi:hypothetical protein